MELPSSFGFQKIRKCLTVTRQNLFLIKRVLKGRLSSTYITLYKKDIQQLYFLKSGKLKPSGSAQFSYYFAVSQNVPQFLESVTESLTMFCPHRSIK